MDQFRLELGKARFGRPSVPLVSNLTGDFVSRDQMTQQDYWLEHMRRPVLFWPGVEACLRKFSGEQTVFLEVGAGSTLAALIGRHLPPSSRALTSLPARGQRLSDQEVLFGTLGELWTRHGKVDWQAFYEYETRQRVHLPHYPFAKVWCALYEPGEEFKLVQQALGAHRLGGDAGGRNPDPESKASALLCAEPGLSPQEPAIDEVRPTEDPASEGDEVERRVAELFKRSLGLNEIGLDDDVMDLGAQSLMLVSLTNSIRGMFGVNVAIKTVIENASARALARVIHELQQSATADTGT